MVKKLSFIPLLVIGNIMCCLFYLSIPLEIKYDFETVAFRLTNDITYGSATCAFYFGSFVTFGLIQRFSLNGCKSELDTFLIELHSWLLVLLGSLYILHYLEIMTTDSKERIYFVVGYIFLLSLKETYHYFKTRYS